MERGKGNTSKVDTEREKNSNNFQDRLHPSTCRCRAKGTTHDDSLVSLFPSSLFFPLRPPLSPSLSPSRFLSFLNHVSPPPTFPYQQRPLVRDMAQQWWAIRGSLNLGVGTSFPGLPLDGFIGGQIPNHNLSPPALFSVWSLACPETRNKQSVWAPS